VSPIFAKTKYIQEVNTLLGGATREKFASATDEERQQAQSYSAEHFVCRKVGPGCRLAH
jgi:hypothetical protein